MPGKTLMLGRTEGKKRTGRQRMRWLDSITNSTDMNLSRLQERGKDRGAWPAAVHEVTKRHDLSTAESSRLGFLFRGPRSTPGPLLEGLLLAHLVPSDCAYGSQLL